jgi:hypothetical protein
MFSNSHAKPGEVVAAANAEAAAAKARPFILMF